MEAHRSSDRQHEAEPLWKRIDRLCEEKGVSTTDLAKAAGVTWAAAARWRKPPEAGKKNAGSVPKLPQLAAIARALSMTIDELRGIYEGHEPTGAGFEAFKGTTVYKSLSSDELIRVLATPLPEDPPLASWLLAGEAQIAARKKNV